MTKYLIYILLFIIVFSCRKKTDEPISVNTNNSGFFVVNEGNYTWGNSSLSFFDKKNNQFHQDIFYEANAVPLGDVAYSMTIHNNKGYIIVNNSGIIYIVNLSDIKYSGKITGLGSPRQMLIINDTLAYVSDLYDTRITKINLQNNSIVGFVNIGHTSEKMILLNGKVYVTTWSYGNMVYSIDILTDNKLDSAIVGKQPNSIVKDKNNNIWVLCDGGFTGSSYGQENASLWCLNSSDLTEIKHFTFSDISMSPVRLCANRAGDTLYYINNNIYRMSITDNLLPNIPLITANSRNFYGLAVNSLTNEIIVTDAKNYVANGETLIFDLNGNLKKSYTAGVNPGWIEIMGN